MKSTTISPSTQQQEAPQSRQRVVVPIALRTPGNIIKHLPIPFDIQRKGNRFEAHPRQSEAEERLLHLPETIEFEMVTGKTVASDKNYRDICEDIFCQLESSLKRKVKQDELV